MTDFQRRLRGFQQRLDQRREERGLSISDLHRSCGLPMSTTRRILVGDIKELPKREQLEALAKGLSWPVEFLQQMALEVIDPDLDLYAEHSEEMKVWIATGERLSERDRRAILRMAEELLRNNNE